MTKVTGNHISTLSFHFKGKREYQEDRIYIDEANRIFIVCDGIGGTEGGALASKKVISFLKDRKEELKEIQNEEHLKAIILKMHDDLLKWVVKKEIKTDMGTTLILLAIVDDRAYVAHVGDSKSYYFSDQKVKWISKDHSVVQELYDAGIIENEKDMLVHPLKNRITSAIMADPNKKQPTISIQILEPVKPGDLFILCTDGAVENYTNDDVVENFTNQQITLDSRWNLFKKNAEHSSDNSSGILVMI